jgi:hypothetical protein
MGTGWSLPMVKRAFEEAILFCAAVAFSLIVWLVGTALLVRESMSRQQTLQGCGDSDDCDF